MLFNSYEFLFLFLPISLFIFFQIGKRGNYQLAIATLVAASFFFYGWWDASYLVLLLFSISFNYLVSDSLSRPSIYKTLPIDRKGLLIFGIIVNLGLIGYFKYISFVVDTTNNVFNTRFDVGKIVLPLAISFFTFTQIAYLADVFYKRVQNLNFLKYCLFVLFFPHLIAGPIVHYKEIVPQFEQKSVYHFSYKNLAVGLTIFFLGMTKKVLLADSIATYANSVFAAANQNLSITFFDRANAS